MLNREADREVDLLLWATGRIPNSDKLQVHSVHSVLCSNILELFVNAFIYEWQIEKAGVKLDELGYITTDEYQNTNVPGPFLAILRIITIHLYLRCVYLVN